jgi:hypothetical protein
LLNRTVNHSHAATAPMNRAGASPWPASASMHSQVVRTLPTSTTNMTGLRTMPRGWSFAKAAGTACQ